MSEHHPEQAIKTLLSMREEELYEQIGRELHGIAAFPPSPQHLVELARNWLQNQRHEITAQVCSSNNIKRIATEGLSDNRIALVLAVSELIVSITIGVSPVIVSVLLVREGLKTLCHDQWEESH